MANPTLSYTDELTVNECPTCGLTYAVSQHFLDKRREYGEDFYCPTGHRITYGKSSAAKEREKRQKVEAELERTSRRLTQAQQAKHTAERQAAARKGQVTKIKNSVKNGKCPCCRRNFPNLQAHMKTVHPEFGNEEER